MVAEVADVGVAEAVGAKGGPSFQISRDGGAGPRPAQSKRGKAWKPFEGFHHNDEREGRTKMPGRNGMGPLGAGPMTGRGMGCCGGAGARLDMPPRGPGFGMGRGRGNGWRRGQMGWRGPAGGFPAAPAREQELAMLKVHAANLDHALRELRSRIGELEPEAGSSGQDTR
jgi:hypothetical protein